MIAAIVGVGGASTMVALTAAERTADAYPAYLERANVGEVVINPAFATREIVDVIRGLPGVARVTSSVLLTASLEEGKPIRRPPPAVIDAIDETTTFVLGSSDGRYFDMDRPVVQSGRMPTGRGEVVVTPETASAHDLYLGEVLPLTFWNFGLPHGLDEEQLAARNDEIVAPLGVEHLRIVGVVTLADEALPGELYPRHRMIVSPDITDKYDCLPSEPPAGLTLAKNVEILAPPDCAVAQTYLSVDLATGADGVKQALDEYLRITNARNVTLRNSIIDIARFEGQEPQYALIPTETRLMVQRVADAVSPSVAALRVLALVAAMLTVVLSGLAVWRESQRTIGVQQQWHQLGVGTGTRAVVLAVPMVAGVLLGTVVAVPSAWFFDPGPQGLISAMEPNPTRELLAPAVLALIGIVLVDVAVCAGLALSITRGAQHRRWAPQRHQQPRGLVLRFGGPVVTEGVRAAYQRRSGLPVIGGLAVAVACLVAAVTFGTSLSALLSKPSAFGWPWDLAAATNAGYGNLDVGSAERLLSDDPDVDSWGYYGFISAISLDGEPMSALIDSGTGSADRITVVQGSLPDTPEEVAIGVTTASERGLAVGDAVELGGLVQPVRAATVSALVVLPTLGPYESDRVSAGSGMLVPFSLFETPGLAWFRGSAASLYAFVGIDLDDDVDVATTIARLEPLLGALELNGVPALTYPEPVRPVEIIDAENTRSLPRTFGLAFGAVGVVGLGAASWVSAHGRRRELAILQSLGLNVGQSRRTVWVHSIATALAALALGVPSGVIAGRAAWRAFAGGLGVVPDPETSPVLVMAVVLVGLGAAWLVALVPSRATVSPAAGLRAE